MFVLWSAAIASWPAGRDLYVGLEPWLNKLPGGRGRLQRLDAGCPAA
jgi:hypothetical protein